MQFTTNKIPYLSLTILRKHLITSLIKLLHNHFTISTSLSNLYHAEVSTLRCQKSIKYQGTKI